MHLLQLLTVLPAILCVVNAYNSGAPFDYFMYTTIYPTAVCRADDDSVPDSCEIPPTTSQWTIHGLWPNFENGSYPQFCHGVPKKFDKDIVKPIISKLEINWPNLYPSKSEDSFWKHEYEKHGTCAQSYPKYESEIAYFEGGLEAWTRFNISAALASIGPSDKAINEQILAQALTPILNGKTFQFHCLKDKKTKEFLLGDIRICLTKDLEIMNCPDERHRNRVPRSSHNHYSQPLPSFQTCPKEFIYLPSENVQEMSSSGGGFWSSLKNAVKGIL